MVGTLSVSHTGSEVVVNFETSPDYWLKETNTYVGKTWLPSVDGKETIHPSQYSVVHELDDSSEGQVSDSVVISGLKQDERVVVIAHATVCGSFPATTTTTTSVGGSSSSSLVPDADGSATASAATTTDSNTGLRGGTGSVHSPDQKWHSKLSSLAKLW